MARNFRGVGSEGSVAGSANPVAKHVEFAPSCSEFLVCHAWMAKRVGRRTTIDNATALGDPWSPTSERAPQEGTRAELDRLLRLRVLRRGLILRCARCNWLDWYAIDHIGQSFRCGRCDQNNFLEQARPIR
jgi:hypothetical protein